MQCQCKGERNDISAQNTPPAAGDFHLFVCVSKQQQQRVLPHYW